MPIAGALVRAMKAIVLLLAGVSVLALALESLASEIVPKGLTAAEWSGIRTAYQAGRHAVHRENDGTLAADNPGQHWRTEFDGEGFTVIPDHGEWCWGLELTGYGERTLLSAASSITCQGGKITCQRDDFLTEWFSNDTRGLEQGWTFQRRPKRDDSSAPLRLHLSIRGELRPRVAADGACVSFQRAAGGNVLNYGGLRAWGSDGKNVPVRFEYAGDDRIVIAIDDQSACYPITIDPIAQQAYLKASNTAAGDSFGISVAISGDTVVVGAHQEDSNASGVNGDQSDNSASGAGAAYVFTRSGGLWSQQAYLKASNAEADDGFGVSVGDLG